MLRNGGEDDQRATKYNTVGCTGAEPFTEIPPVRESKDWCLGYLPGRVDSQKNVKCVCGVWSGGGGVTKAKKTRVARRSFSIQFSFVSINRLESDKVGPVG